MPIGRLRTYMTEVMGAFNALSTLLVISTEAKTSPCVSVSLENTQEILQSLTCPHIRRKQRSAATPNLTDALTEADAVDRLTVFQGLHKCTECGTQNRRRRRNQIRRRNGYEKDDDKRYTRR